MTEQMLEILIWVRKKFKGQKWLDAVEWRLGIPESSSMQFGGKAGA